MRDGQRGGLRVVREIDRENSLRSQQSNHMECLKKSPAIEILKYTKDDGWIPAGPGS